jgi:ATP-dependent exoDNAse (exonuclease V) beta subunit
MTDRSVVVANAGSGKTYLLANRLVRWMLRARRDHGSASPERILAVTFTRKAAGEITARVMRHLALGASSEARRAEFAADGQVGDFEAWEYAAVLAEFVAAMHRVNISTIDGFFVQLASAFASDIGVPDAWSIGAEDVLAAQRRDAIGRAIAGDVHRATDLARRISDGRPKPEVQSGMDAALGEALELWQRCAASDDPWSPWRALAGRDVTLFPGARRAKAEDIRRAVEAVRRGPLPSTKAGAPVKRWVDAVARVTALAEEGAWIDLLGDSLVQGVHGGGLFAGHAAPAPVQSALDVLVGQGLSVADALVRARLEATAELASVVDAELRRSQREDGVLGFGDIASALARAEAGGRLDAMRERLDRAIVDLAVDEFQDTSPGQWSVLSPLVDEILATGDRRLLVVGDPKQSIYAWRGGTPALLGPLCAREGLDPDVTLSTSWRSSPVVLDFVNVLFGGLASAVRGSALDDRMPAAAEALRGAGLPVPPGAADGPLVRAIDAWTFTPHEAAAPNARMPGAVYAHRAPSDDREALASTAASIVAGRVRERPGAVIAVLVRSNRDVAACAAAIRALGIEASDEGRSPLEDSAAVATVLGMLRLADRPDDRISHYLVTRAPAAGLLGLEPMERHGRADRADAAARGISRRVREELLEHGLRGWIARAAEALRPACARHDLERLRQLAVLVDGLDPALAARPGEVVRAAESHRARTGERARVRVMTVHASKGLEFDEVVLASLGEAMGEARAGASAFASLSPDPSRPPAAIAPIVSAEMRAFSPLLEAFRREVQVAQASDDLSSLYVGVTRAREAVHLVCPPPSAKDEPRPTPTWLMRMAVPGFDAAYLAGPAEGPFWSFVRDGGDLGPLPARAAVETVVDAPAPAAPQIAWVERAGTARAPSVHDGDGSSVFAREFVGDDDGARGTLAHAWFERVEWLSGTAPDAAIGADARAAAALEVGRAIDGALAAEVESAVAKACAGPMGAVLRPDRCTGWSCERLEVRAEMAFAADLPAGPMRGRMDRVVLGVRGGRVVRAEVVDWKTGARGLSGAALEERIAPYRAQMADYRAALAAMLGLEPACVTAVLAMVDRGELIEA